MTFHRFPPPEKWSRAIRDEQYSWQKHALIRIAEREIPQQVVLDIIENCDIIEEYPDDKPFPSALFIDEDKVGSPLHVVASFEIEQQWVYFITAYYPDSRHFEAGFRKRRNK